MPWAALAIVALLALMLIVRVLIRLGWMTYRLSHKQAAALRASLFPTVFIVASLVNGIDGIGGWLFLVGGALLLFFPSYAFGELLNRYFGGEMDPPTSPTYRRRS